MNEAEGSSPEIEIIVGDDASGAPLEAMKHFCRTDWQCPNH
jgi:hypothetical protein